MNTTPNSTEPAVRLSPSRHPGPPLPAARGIPYWQLAREHKFLILGFIVLGAIAGTVAVTLKTPLYQAATTVVFNQGIQGMNPQAGGDAGAAASSMTQIAILLSRTLVNRVADRVNQELTPQLSAPNTPFTSLRNRVPFLRQDPLLQSREAVGVAAATVGARPVIGTRIISIECISTSPEVAATFVNTLASEYQSLTQATRSNETQLASQWIESQLEESRARLQEASEKLRAFAQKSGSFPQQASLADSKIASLRADVSGLQIDRMRKEATLQLARTTPPDNLPEVMNDANLQGIKNQIIDQQRQIAELEIKLMPENPAVKKHQQKIDELQEDYKREVASLIKRLQSDYDEAADQEKRMTAAYNAQAQSAAAQADKSTEFEMLNREVDTAQLLYNNLLTQSSQAALMTLAPSGNIRVVDAAFPNSVPFSPQPLRNITEWSLGGGALGCALVLLREMVRRKRLERLFDSPGYTQTILGVPELGVIPSSPAAKPVRKRHFRASARRPKPAGVADGLGLSAADVRSMPNVSAIGNGEHSTMLSESFRQTLVSLLRTKPRGHNPVYVITSAGPGEGKTTLSANLARAMAETGQRVLLVDADLRRPHVHNLLGLGDLPGLSDVLSGPLELRDLALDSFIHATPIDKLSVMTHGLTECGTSLFFSPRVAELVTLLQSRFDCVLFDTAPALPFPDARLWGKHADGVVLVVRSGVTTREGASAACERFLSDGIPVLGTILNDWTPQAGSALPYYYKSYQSAGPKQS